MESDAEYHPITVYQSTMMDEYSINHYHIKSKGNTAG